MVLAVMTRASLGHTGRALRAGPVVAGAYALVAAAALLRAFGPAPMPPFTAYGLAGTAGAAGFLLFLVRFAPILIRQAAGRA